MGLRRTKVRLRKLGRPELGRGRKCLTAAVLRRGVLGRAAREAHDLIANENAGVEKEDGDKDAEGGKGGEREEEPSGRADKSRPLP